jgi:hypothetical protein
MSFSFLIQLNTNSVVDTDKQIITHGGAELTLFRTCFCPTVWGRGSVCTPWDDVMPFQNPSSDNGSVEYVACQWATKSIFICRVYCGLYGHWTSRSRFLTVWGYLKECVYSSYLHILQELKCLIRYTATINQELLCRVFDNSWNVLTVCYKWRRLPSRCYLSKVINK